MSLNLLETVNGFFNNDLISKAASSLGESESGVQKAITGLVPSVLAGLLTNANSSSNAANNIFNMAKEASASGILNSPGRLIGTTASGISGLLNMARNLFGDKLGSIANLIGNWAGIKSSSASSLANIAAPVTLGAIGRYATDNNLNAGSLVSMLMSQKDRIMNALPAGLGGLSSILGLSSLSNIGSRMSSVGPSVATETKKGMGWLLPLLLAIVVIGLLWYLIKGCNATSKSTATDTTTAITPVATEVPPPVTVTSIKVKLPDGTELDALQGGIEDRLVAFLNDPNSKPGKDVWFDFDNLNFETNSATITSESQKQVNNIAAILKAFPKAKIKIGGYTDKTGNDAANKKLSQDRADAVVAALKTAGTNAQQLLGGEGYGSGFATVPASASEEERKKDRRIAVSPREK